MEIGLFVSNILHSATRKLVPVGHQHLHSRHCTGYWGVVHVQVSELVLVMVMSVCWNRRDNRARLLGVESPLSETECSCLNCGGVPLREDDL